MGLLLAAWLVMQVFTAGVGDLYNETDGQYTGASKSMVESGDWLIPYNNEVPRLVKPPLLYWAMSSSFILFGLNEFAARLPNAIGIGLLMLLTFLIGERLRSTWTGFAAAMIFLLLPGTSIMGRVVMPEPLFCAAIVTAIYALLRLRESCERQWVLLFWLGATLAVFVKGLHGLLYPAALAGLAALFWRECRLPFRRLFDWRGILLFLVVQLPWLWLVENRYPGFLNELFVNQQMGHLLKTRWPPMPDAVPREQFLMLHLAWFFPWIWFALAGLTSPRRWWNQLKNFDTGFPWLWAALIFGTVLAAGQRQDYYAMAGWPAAAILMASVWSDVTRVTRLRVVAAGIALLALIGLIALAWMPTPDVASDLTHAADRATATQAVAALPAQFWAPMRTAGLWAAAILATGFGIGWWLGRSGNARLIFAPVSIACILIGLMAIHGMAFAAPFFSSAEGARVIQRLAETKAKVVFDGPPQLASSLCFYLDRPFYYVGQPAEHEFGVRATGEGADRFLPTETFIEDWRKPGAQFFLIIESSREPYWRDRLGNEWHLVSRYGSHMVVASFDPFSS